MAFDGITVAAIVNELNYKIKDGRINKISQTEKDELQINIRSKDSNYKLILNSNPSLPLIYLTDRSKQGPKTAPNFCMLLRKYIGNGHITQISQPGMERVVDFEISHLDDMGDMKLKHLIIEIMGKHSNIIFTDEKYKILDSIRHVTSVTSSIRQVLPGRDYFIPNTMDKINPFEVSKEEFFDIYKNSSKGLSCTMYTSFTGISPQVAESICYRNKLDSSISGSKLAKGDINLLWIDFYEIINHIKNGRFEPLLYEKNGKPQEYSFIPLSIYGDCKAISYDSASRLIEDYYSKKNKYSRMRQKSSDLRKHINTAIERESKKYNIQLKQLRDTEKKDKFKNYGNLIMAYSYKINPQAKEFEAEDFSDGKKIKIPLDPSLTAVENANKYYEKYSKMKRTADSLGKIIIDTKNSIDYLGSVNHSLDIAESEEDLKAISDELYSAGYLRKNPSGRKKEKNKSRSKPMHFISSDGFHIYVGKNNTQNDEITFKLANGNDLWFHSKDFPGSHVIVKTENKILPDRTYEEAACLAAYYSSGSSQNVVNVDYTQRKNVKKVPGTKPGFVIFHNNYSISAKPSVSCVRKVED